MTIGSILLIFGTPYTDEGSGEKEQMIKRYRKGNSFCEAGVENLGPSLIIEKAWKIA